jgi:proline iminopeptidase
MEDNELLAFARIECHYMVNQLFFPEDDFLLKRMSLIAHLPVWIAQGRYDVICPVVTAYELSQALPKAS